MWRYSALAEGRSTCSYDGIVKDERTNVIMGQAADNGKCCNNTETNMSMIVLITIMATLAVFVFAFIARLLTVSKKT